MRAILHTGQILVQLCSKTISQSVPHGPALCFLFRFQVLKRTLGDIMCDVSRLGSVQKWVTLQPNSEYNSYERCVEKTQLDVRAIANEIAREVLSNYLQCGDCGPCVDTKLRIAF